MSFRDRLAVVRSSFFHASVSVIFSLLILWLLSMPEQSLELWRVLVEDAKPHPVPLIATIVGLALASLTLGYCASVTTTEHVGRVARVVVVALCLIAPWVGAFLGIREARAPVRADTSVTQPDAGAAVQTPPATPAKTVTSPAADNMHCLLIGVGIMVFLVLVIAIALRHRIRLSWVAFVLLLIPSWAVLITITLRAHAARSTIGPLAIVLFAVAAWLPLLTLVQLFGRRVGFPMLLVVIAWAALWSGLDTNDNHQVRHTRRGGFLPLRPASTAFTEWLATRRDRALFPTYPVILVAAEGGGLRAAFQTALVLATLQDRCPRFAEHTFAISGVSGGSVGASVFTALAHRYVRNAPLGPCTTSSSFFAKKVEGILGRDYLSPPLATTATLEAMQRLVPRPIRGTDRAVSLERALEEAWTEETGGGELSMPLDEFYPTFPHGALPALFLNTTNVETGNRMLISPLYPLDEEFNRVASLSDVDNHLTMPLSTATFLSARFPLITPSGYIMSGDQKQRYVDGGYSENSGAGTLNEIFNALKIYEQDKNNPQFHIIVIRIGFERSPNPKDVSRRQERSRSFDEVIGPARTLLNTMNGRGTAATYQLQTAINMLANQGHGVWLYDFVFTDERIPLPLGWLLSQATRGELHRQLGTRADPNSSERMGNVVDHIARDLSADGEQ